MKQSMIELMYLDNCGWMERIKSNEEYRKLSGEYADILGRWNKESDGEVKERLDKIWSLGAGMEAEASYTHFAEGFKFGFKLAMEVFAEDDNESV